jgi:chromate transporter
VLAGAAFLATWLWQADAVLVLLAAGCLGVLIERARGAAAGFALLAATPAVPAAPIALPGVAGLPALDLAWLFFKAGAFVYGGGYVILPFVYREAVERYGWLDLRTFLDGIALSQITPGPIVNLSAFVGYQVGGLRGAALASAAVFVPAFAAILLAIPLMNRIRRAEAVQAFLRAVNAAVVGAILGATVPLAQGAVVSLPTGAIALASLLLLWRYRLDTLYLVLGGAALGLILS